MGDVSGKMGVELPKTLADTLGHYDPKGGRPVPVAALYRANTCTAVQFEALKAYSELVSARNWAQVMDRQRADSMARQWASDHGARKGVPA
mgnify:CR=1 FL=1